MAAQARADADHARWLAEQQRKLAALAPNAPLREWLPWLDVSRDDLREPALAAVRRRPTLEPDLAGMLRGTEASRALRFLWLWMPAPPASLAVPTRDAVASLPAWADRYLASPPSPPPPGPIDNTPVVFPPENPVDLSDMTQAAIVLADAYRSSGPDFTTPIRAFAATLQHHALSPEQFDADPTYQSRAYLDAWRGRPAAATPSSHLAPRISGQ